MKRLLLLLLPCFCSAFLFAQNDPAVFEQSWQNDVYMKKLQSNLKSVSETDTAAIDLLKSFSLSPRKPGVYPLPQDNMPCIVPDMSQTVAIPNLWKGKKKAPYISEEPRIPNRWRLAPSRPLLTYPKDVTK